MSDKPFFAPGKGGQSSQDGTSGPVLKPEEARQQRFRRLQRPATESVVAFSAVPELFVTIRRHPEASLHNLPAFTADLVAQVSKLEQAEGGNGVVLVRDGSREEKDSLVLRLLPTRADAGAGARLSAVADHLSRLMSEARDNRAAQQDAGYANLLTSLGQLEEVALAATEG